MMAPSASVRATLVATLGASQWTGLPGHSTQEPSWHQYVRSPSSTTVKPIGIVANYTTGDIQNPDGLVNGKDATVFSRATSQDTAPTLVVDFGQNVVGQLSIGFAGSTNGSQGLPGMRLAFSETLQFLGDRSDFTRSDNAGGVSYCS